MSKKDCNKCPHYKYIRCYGDDCHHPDAPHREDDAEEPLAENRIGKAPKWCPL